LPLLGPEYSSWRLPLPVDENQLINIDLPHCLKVLLIRRGLDLEADVHQFLRPRDLEDPRSHFRDLNQAILRLKAARENKELVAICGDYDADGMTSAALLVKALKEMNIDAIAAIPNRLEEGYGLNTNMVRKLHSKGSKLLITVDNGINAFDAINLATELQIDIVLTDHHEIKASPPSVLALLHPSTTPKASPYRELAGVGLAYILASTLANEFKSVDALRDSLDLFCIGTVADMAPLKGANRQLLIKGLPRLSQTKSEGLRALYKLIGIKTRNIDATMISFQIAPRINAVGRIGNPELILKLFLEEDADKAMDLAKECEELNRQRRELSSGIEEEALAILEADQGALSPFLLLAQNHWHQGVIGIVASKIVERFQRPTALLAGCKDGFFRASVRAPEGFVVNKALEACANKLESYGGHPAAGGFTIKAENIASLHEQLNIFASDWLTVNSDNTLLSPEANITFKEITWDFWSSLQKLEPFGIRNPRPLFWSRGCEVKNKSFLRGGHLKLTLSQQGTELSAIYWRANENNIVPQFLDIAFSINTNVWNQKKSLQLEIKAIRKHEVVSTIRKSDRFYRCFIRNEEEVVIQNKSLEEIKYSNQTPYALKSSLINVESNYIVNLIEESKISLGLIP